MLNAGFLGVALACVLALGRDAREWLPAGAFGWSAIAMFATAAPAYALHPAFGDARIIEADAGVRPAFPDNVPRVIVRGRQILVNGLYRHGFLLAPALAELVADYLAGGAVLSPLISEE